jgi:hypothetical protein
MVECLTEANSFRTQEPAVSLHPAPDNLALNRQAESPPKQVDSGCLLPELQHNWTWQHEPDALTGQAKGNR